MEHKMVKERHSRASKFEILRIFSIFVIIIFHSIYNLDQTRVSENSRFLYDFFYYFGELGVNCFILISGYFFAQTRFSWKKVCLLCLEVEFYVILSKMILVIGGVNQWGDWSIIDYFFPILRPKYWFATVYIFIYLISPFLQKMIDSLERTEYRRLLAISIFIWSVFPTIYCAVLPDKNDVESMVYYNRYLWLIVVYLIGAYINRFGYRFLNDLKKSLFSAVLFLFLIIAYIFVVEKGFYPISGKAPTLFWTPNSVLELGLSISVFASFYYINLIKPYRVVNYIASCSFGIYLLHDGAAKQYIWD